MSDITRAFPLEDIRILSRADGGDFADGRTVEAYAAVFDVEAEIMDHEGHYLEKIDRAAFNKAIRDAAPQGSRTTWGTKVFYNHGMTLHGTPSEQFSKTLGRTIDIKADSRGLLTVTRYNNTPLADEVLEMIRNGDITGQSFSGRIIRSNPARTGRAPYRANAAGKLPVVRRLELGIREYGPTPIPAYATADVVGVRADLAANLAAQVSEDHDAGRRLLDALLPYLSTTRSGPVDVDTSLEDAVPDEPPTDEVEHSSRDALRQRIAAARSQFPDLFGDDPTKEPS